MLEVVVADERDKQEMYGHLTCKECGQRFSSPINSELPLCVVDEEVLADFADLSAAVDVYCE